MDMLRTRVLSAEINCHAMGLTRFGQIETIPICTPQRGGTPVRGPVQTEVVSICLNRPGAQSLWAIAADNPHVRRSSPCLWPGFQSLEGRDRTGLETFTQPHRLQPGDGLPEPFRTTITDALGALVLRLKPCLGQCF